MAVALKTEKISKSYRVGSNVIKAVEEVSISLEAGEFVALVGPSGSGKTTTLAILAALLQPTEGSIMIDGEELTTMKEAQRARFRRRKIGFTFQANNLVPYLTALENVELMLRLNGEFNAKGKARAKDLLVRLGLEDRLNSLPRQLSGGQQQRVSIARSLANRPALVLADEPTASLDSQRAFQVVQTMADLIHEQKRAGIMVTHDLRLVEYVDRVIQMLDGRVMRIVTSPEDLGCLANPADCRRIPMNTLGFEGEAAD